MIKISTASEAINNINSSKSNPKKRYSITFPGESPMTLSKEEILSPTLLKNISYIEKEPCCTGVTLKNGIQIKMA